MELFIFDVESVGLHGEAFAVAGGIYDMDSMESPQSFLEFCHACPPENAKGTDSDREWINANIPSIPTNHLTPKGIRDTFWIMWTLAKRKYPNIIMAAECGWPVEARFLAACIDDEPEERRWKGPYPLHEIASFMVAAGMDPMAKWERIDGELPAHHPLSDVRLSARILATASKTLDNPSHSH